MPTPEFKYQELFPLGKDETEYYLLTNEHVSVAQFEGKEVLKVEAEGLTKLANAAMRERKTEAITPYFRSRWYLNGNMHLTFLRPDLLKILNLRGGDHAHVPGPEEGR